MKYILILLLIVMILIAGCGQAETTLDETDKEQIPPNGIVEEELFDDNLDEALDELDQLES